MLKICLYFCVLEPKKSRFRLHAAVLAVFQPKKMVVVVQGKLHFLRPAIPAALSPFFSYLG